jgi:hypothetical protein
MVSAIGDECLHQGPEQVPNAEGREVEEFESIVDSPGLAKPPQNPPHSRRFA